MTPISVADFLQRQRLVAAIQAEAADDDLLLALVKPLQDLADLHLALRLGVLLLVLVAAVVLGRR